jgi:hypothetical protein
MAYTDKQVRNGATGAVGDNTSVAQPGPMPTAEIAAEITQAVSVAESRDREAVDLLASPAGSGVAGHQIGGAGSMWEWDSGLAVNEVAGES